MPTAVGEVGLDGVMEAGGLAVKASIGIRRAADPARDELLADLKAAFPVDIVLLMLHGAMIAHGYDDCDEDLIGRLRDIVGPHAVIGVELDLHCL